jgi:8-oxo-dGTP pyrophosphatase MutT (NUDIX family)
LPKTNSDKTLYFGRTVAKSISQVGVIPILNGQVCLVTSRSGARWVIPKGHIESHQTAIEAARQEAWEEAGVVGDFQGTALGSFSYRKFEQDYQVTVFVMQVKLVVDTWPEKSSRQREWVEPTEAIRRVLEPELRVMIGQLFQEWAD